MAKHDNKLTIERLLEVVDYHANGSYFTWRGGWPRNRAAGKPAGTLVSGYLQICIDQVKYKAHRLVWLCVYGEWPKGDIDHANGNRLDNDPDNLRIATPSQNGANKRLGSNNTSGFKGVSYCKSRGNYEARLKVNGKNFALGRFKTPEEAHEAYKTAAIEHHGEFSRTE